AQPSACAPIVVAIEENREIQPVTPGASIAEGTRISAPSRSGQIMRAITETNGTARAVSEDEIVDALRELWGQGLYVEPTAAVGAAAFRQMAINGDVPEGEIVVLLTGSGLKATETIGKLVEGEN
ncbi:MAG: pyridoxal-phosphate dependent enzyme, partial [Nitrolancea sp.]